MKKSTKICFIIASLMVLLGGSLFAAAMSVNNWDWMTLSTDNFVTNTYEVSEEFSGISIITNTADIKLLPSNDGACRIVCYESEKEKHTVRVVDGELVINLESTKAWYDYISVVNGSPTLTVYLPEEEYGKIYIKESTGDIEISKEFTFESAEIKTSTGDVKYCAATRGELSITADTGDIFIQNISAEKINISVTSGRVEAFDVSCTGDLRINVNTGKTKLTRLKVGSLHSNGASGDITLTSVIVAGKIDISRDTGDVKFEHSDADNIYVRTDTGDVRGTLLSSKMFFVHSDTGVERVPKCNSGGICEVNSDTGDIIFEIVD